jgi:hypothetical protein
VAAPSNGLLSLGLIKTNLTENAGHPARNGRSEILALSEITAVEGSLPAGRVPARFAVLICAKASAVVTCHWAGKSGPEHRKKAELSPRLRLLTNPSIFSAGFSFVVDGICGAAGLAVFAGHQ